ncbi:MAG: hypothetical protein ACLSGB_10985 [Dorea sp.]
MESFGKVKEESNDEGNVYWIAENFEEFWKMLKTIEIKRKGKLDKMHVEMENIIKTGTVH